MKKISCYSRILCSLLISSLFFAQSAQAQQDFALNAAQQPDIVGGEEADIGEYPWQAVLQASNSQGSSYLCGGSLIAPQWVMTAAHCVYDNTTHGAMTVDVVILGAHDITKNSETGRQSFGATRVVIHPNYNPNTINNDIALIELDDLAVMNDYVAVVALAASPEDDALLQSGTEATVSGWGETGESSSSSPVLMEVMVKVVLHATCQISYAGFGAVVTNNMICAGFPEGGKDTCRGDSGGPLVAPAASSIWKQIGIVSWGNYPCAQADFYGVYTKVSNYHDWILAQMGGNNNTPVPTATPQTATPQPTHTPQPAFTPTPTATSSFTPTPLATATPAVLPTPFENLVVNSDFESGASSEWESSSLQARAIISNQVSVAPASGEYVAWLGAVNHEESRLWQQITLPATKPLYLSYDYAVDSSENGCFRDLGKVYVGDERIIQYVLCTDTAMADWQHQVLDIGAYAGKTINLQFFARNNASAPSDFFIDNIQIGNVLALGEVPSSPTAVRDGGSGAAGTEVFPENSKTIFLPLIGR